LTADANFFQTAKPSAPQDGALLFSEDTLTPILFKSKSVVITYGITTTENTRIGGKLMHRGTLVAVILLLAACKTANTQNSESQSIESRPPLSRLVPYGTVQRLTVGKFDSENFCVHFVEMSAQSYKEQNKADDPAAWTQSGSSVSGPRGISIAKFREFPTIAKTACTKAKERRKAADDSKCLKRADGADCTIRQPWAKCQSSEEDSSTCIMTYSGEAGAGPAGCAQYLKETVYDCEYQEKTDPDGILCSSFPAKIFQQLTHDLDALREGRKVDLQFYSEKEIDSAVKFLKQNEVKLAGSASICE
jgi:hypothetical protein